MECACSMVHTRSCNVVLDRRAKDVAFKPRVGDGTNLFALCQQMHIENQHMGSNCKSYGTQVRVLDCA
jgi:hypothetical protein